MDRFFDPRLNLAVKDCGEFVCNDALIAFGDPKVAVRVSTIRYSPRPAGIRFKAYTIEVTVPDETDVEIDRAEGVNEGVVFERAAGDVRTV